MEITLVKTMDGALRPATEGDAAELGKIKVGQGVRVKVARHSARSLQHHRLFFGGLMRLAFDYWEPVGGLITPSERSTIANFAKWLDSKAGNNGAVARAGEAYLAELTERRGQKVEAPEKSMTALLDWVKVEAGHCELVQTPTGVAKRPMSINFYAMDQEQFDDFYRRAFSVVWRFILHRTFNSETDAQNAIDQLLSIG